MKRTIRFAAKYVAILAEFMSKADVRFWLEGINVKPHPVKGVLLGASDGHTAVLIHDPEGMSDGSHIINLSSPLIAATKKKVPLTREKPESIEIQGGVIAVEMRRTDGEPSGIVGEGTVYAEHSKSIDGKYPDLVAIVPQETNKQSATAVNADYMARLAKVMKAAGFKYPHIQLMFHGEDKVVSVRSNQLPEALFLIMPAVMDEKDERQPCPDWITEARIPEEQAA